MKVKIFITIISICIISCIFKYFNFVVNADYSQINGKKIQCFDELVVWSNDSQVNEEYINNQIKKRLLVTSPLWMINVLDSMNQNVFDSRMNEMKLMGIVMSQFDDEPIVAMDNGNIDYDSMRHLMEFSNLYWSASELETKYKVAFQTIASHYTGKIANTLRYYGTSDPSLVGSPKYCYLKEYCSLNYCPVNVEVPKVTKFFMHLANQRWSHLINATWSHASIALKFAIFAFFLLTCASYLCLIRFVVVKFKNK